MNRYICIHGHFYQPPRENPWLESIEIQPSAYPDHDWNQRITSECYAPNGAARILDDTGSISTIVNNYAYMSFNFGPTLLSWLQTNDTTTYDSIIASDKQSQSIFNGHGSALAQCYNHIIMPLANSQDKETQIIWGIEDFFYRFGRRPEGMWLPETAVDLSILELLAKHGIKFTILAPRQAKSIRHFQSQDWIDVSGSRIDPRRVYQCNLESGKTIALFFYDGPISQEIAFAGLLKNGANLANRLLGCLDSDPPEAQLAHIATDGETYGHHHNNGEMALAYCFEYLNKNHYAQLINYGEFLEKFPPQYEVTIFENSSWSCVHGIERWRRNCGCCSGVRSGWQQEWRGPLRQALDRVRDQMIPVFEKSAGEYFKNCWDARNGYIHVILNRSDDSLGQFFRTHADKKLSAQERIRAVKWMESQRNMMLAYTSCGWFFDEISGIETTQIMQYAARAMQLFADLTGDSSLENEFCDHLKAAPSNIRQYQNGAEVYTRHVAPHILSFDRVVAHYGLSSLFEEYPEEANVYCFHVKNLYYKKYFLSEKILLSGKAQVCSTITKEEKILDYIICFLGGQNIWGGVLTPRSEFVLRQVSRKIFDLYRRDDPAQIRKILEQEADGKVYSIPHLFKDEQQKVSYQILDSTLESIRNSLEDLTKYHEPIIQSVKQLEVPIPRLLTDILSVTFNYNLIHELVKDKIDMDSVDAIIRQAGDWPINFDKITIAHILKNQLMDIISYFSYNYHKINLLEKVEKLLKIIYHLDLQVDLWTSQNIYFVIAKKIYPDFQQKASQGDAKAQKWIEIFERVGRFLKVRL